MVKRLSNTDQNNNKLENIPTPVNNGDAVNKAYADTKGDVTGPSSATDGNIAVFDTTTGKKIKDVGQGGYRTIYDAWAFNNIFAQNIDVGPGGGELTITNLATPSAPQDAATKAYVDASVVGGSGDVVGPASANDFGVAVFDGTTGKLIKNSNLLFGQTANLLTTGTGGLTIRSGGSTPNVNIVDINFSDDGVGFNGYKAYGMANPTNAQDGATKAYVDSLLGGGTSWKYVTSTTASGTATKVATTSSGTYSPATGDLLMVTFSNGINVSTPTLNIDGSGAKNIRLGNQNVTTAFIGTASSIILPLFYDGTYYQMFGSNKNDNTTYTNITNAEIDTGTATTGRAITGATAAYIITKAQTGVVKSTTTNKITAASTAPASPTAGDLWFDNSTLPENLAPNAIVWKETPAGAVNGINFAFTTAQPYVSGSLQGFINGVAQSGFINETGPGSGVFEFDVAPQTGDNVRVQYQVRSTSAGNAQSLGNVTLSGLLEALYPVGSVYVSGTSTMPALIAGVGTWARLKGRMIVGLDEDQVEFDTINETGGAKTHTLTEPQLPSISASWGIHGQENGTLFASKSGYATGGLFSGKYGNLNYYSGSQSFTNPGIAFGKNQAHPIMNPYKAKYMWERTA